MNIYRLDVPRLTCIDLRAVNSLDNKIQTDARRFVDLRYSCTATCKLETKLHVTGVIHVSQRPTIDS